MLLRDHPALFIDFCAIERQLSRCTVEAYTSDLADYAKWASEHQPVQLLEGLKAYLQDMITERGLSAATVRRRFACLHAYFRWAAREGYSEDPFVRWRPTLPRRRRLPRNLSKVEAGSLVSGARSAGEDEMLQISISLMIATGLRVGELCKLRADDISPDGRMLHVHGKGSRDRVAYVADAQLQFRLSCMAKSRSQTGGASAPLFLNQRGFPMRSQSIRSRLRKLAGQAGIARRVTPHMLRHTAATLLIENGVDIRYVQRLLGHSTIATTEIYTHVCDEALRTTLERADVLGGLGAR
jgi:site-specific recombinase XerD